MPILVEFALFALFVIALTAFLAIIIHTTGTGLSKKSNFYKTHLTESQKNWRTLKRDET